MATRDIHVIHLLIRSLRSNGVTFLVCPHDKWLDDQARPFLTLPTKKSVSEPLAQFLQGTSLEEFVDAIAQEELGLRDEDYALEHELEPAIVEIDSPTQHVATRYTIYPIDIWVDANQHEQLRAKVGGQWLTCDEATDHTQLSPTARGVFQMVKEREERLAADPTKDQKPDAPHRLLRDVPSQPSMDSLAKKWFGQNKRGVRYLDKHTLDRILDTGNRAFNLRVADPYLRYHQQGLGFTWSFFTHKDAQDVHVHGAPVVEIYGVLEGRMEIWWKPYYDRGTSAWCHRILQAGDWIEVDSLQCHIVRWLGEGKGVVFKAGPGPLAEVGKLGVKGKTPCKDCPCMKPQQVAEMEAAVQR